MPKIKCQTIDYHFNSSKVFKLLHLTGSQAPLLTWLRETNTYTTTGSSITSSPHRSRYKYIKKINTLKFIPAYIQLFYLIFEPETTQKFDKQLSKQQKMPVSWQCCIVKSPKLSSTICTQPKFEELNNFKISHGIQEIIQHKLKSS